MPEPHYDRMFRRLEGVRWELSDLPFDSIDRGKVSARTLDFVRVNCLMELSSLYATRMFLRDFRHEHGFDRTQYSSEQLAAYESGLAEINAGCDRERRAAAERLV